MSGIIILTDKYLRTGLVWVTAATAFSGRLASEKARFLPTGPPQPGPSGMSDIMRGQVSMGYGIPRPARDGVGGRVGERPSYLHDRVRFPCRPRDPRGAVQSRSPSALLFDAVVVAIRRVTPRRPHGVRCCH